MKISNISFYVICAIFGIFNSFSGLSNLFYALIALTVAIIVSVMLKKYDQRVANYFKRS